MPKSEITQWGRAKFIEKVASHINQSLACREAQSYELKLFDSQLV